MPIAPPQVPVHLIAGPTASGKSRLALDLARRLGGVVVNADAIQLYADLRVLSARPTPEDESQVPHRLYGVADGADAWSVGRWARAVQPLLTELADEGRPAVIVGGTGLYFRALVEGLAEIPAVPAALRAELLAQFASEGEALFRDRLAAVDPEAARRIETGDRQRLIRALEVHAGTGRSLSAWRADTRPLLAPGSWTGLVVEPPRDELYARCDARLAAMLDDGAVEEARTLATRGLAKDLPVMKAVGLREILGWLNGDLTRDEALAAGQQETRRYAKRQMTWFRNQTPHWRRVSLSRAQAPHAQSRAGRDPRLPS
jgi:tRNA dimethylallyltransferase